MPRDAVLRFEGAMAAWSARLSYYPPSWARPACVGVYESGVCVV